MRSRSTQDSGPRAPSADLDGRYFDDGDGLRLTLSGWSPSTTGTLVVHGRSSDRGYLKSAHDLFADGDVDFYIAREIIGDRCEVYLPHGAILGYAGAKLLISVSVFTSAAREAQPALASEDLLTLDAVDRPFSVVAFLRPLLVMMKALAEADGRLVTAEARYVRDFVKSEFNPSPDEVEELRRFLNSTHSITMQEATAMLRLRLPLADADALGQLLGGLCVADGQSNAREGRLLRELLSLQGMSASDLDRFLASLGLPDQSRIDDCLTLLGLSGAPTREELQRAWRQAASEFHPDRYHALGMPDAVKEMIACRSAEINAAYEALRKAYGYTA